MTNVAQPWLCFLDVETTGLDYKSDMILEVGMIIVNRDLEQIATWGRTIHWGLIEYDQRTGFYTPPFGVSRVVAEMHEESGLWEDSYKSNVNHIQVFAEASFWIEQQTAGISTPLTLAGSTIGFDMHMLYEWDERWLSMFNYRSLDVSSYKLAYLEWVEAQAEIDELPCEPHPVGNRMHRSLPDCQDSIAELKFYRRKMRWIPDA